MKVLERLKLQLSNKEYYTDQEYSIFLEENSLNPTDEYDKATMEIQLLETNVLVLETLSNDVDLMRKIQTNDIATIDQAYKYISAKITSLNEKILTLKEQAQEDGYSNINPLFFN